MLHRVTPVEVAMTRALGERFPRGEMAPAQSVIQAIWDDWRERAAILEHDAGLARGDAEWAAAELVAESLGVRLRRE